MESSYSYIIDYHAKIKIAQRVSNCSSLYLYFLELLATAKKQVLFFCFLVHTVPVLPYFQEFSQ